LLEPVLLAKPSRVNQHGRDFLGLGHLTGYDDWELYLQLLHVGAASILPKPLLQDTVDSVRQWHRSPERHDRFQHLVHLLRQKWRVEPSLKLLIFAGYPGLASNLADQLSTEFGEDAVAEFRSGMTRLAKEEAVQSFRSDARKRLLVCDESGGEGRNFEFAGALIHFDQPWHVGRIEQRIGRLDRIGRDAYGSDVRSLVILAKNSVEEALVSCYNEGFGVYTESISGLEFSLREQEERLCEVTLDDSANGLTRLIPELKQAAEDERARDEHQALLDWASFQENRVRRYLSVHTKPEVEKQLEVAFVTYFRQLSDAIAAKPYGDNRSNDGLWRFKTDSVRFGKVLPPTLPGQIIGTFRRSIAQKRLDLEFFQVGNPFFDSVVNATANHPFGRTYVVHCKAPNRPPWMGFEFVFAAHPRRDNIAARSDLVHLIDSYFSLAPIHIFVDREGRVDGDTAGLRTIRRALTKDNKGTTWNHLWQDREELLDSLVATEDWAGRVYESAELAKEHATQAFRERLEPALSEQCRRWENLIREVTEKRTQMTPVELASIHELLESARNWNVQVEGAGFLAINQRL
jgi:ATP-dependent helicase HepA